MTVKRRLLTFNTCATFSLSNEQIQESVLALEQENKSDLNEMSEALIAVTDKYCFNVRVCLISDGTIELENRLT